MLEKPTEQEIKNYQPMAQGHERCWNCKKEFPTFKLISSSTIYIVDYILCRGADGCFLKLSQKSNKSKVAIKKLLNVNPDIADERRLRVKGTTGTMSVR